MTTNSMQLKAAPIKPGLFNWLKIRYDVTAIAVLAASSYLAAKGIPLLDPTAGQDIWGDISKIPTILLNASSAACLAYLLDKTLFKNFDDKEEVELVTKAITGKNREATLILVWTNIRVLVPFMYIFKQLVGA